MTTNNQQSTAKEVNESFQSTVTSIFDATYTSLHQIIRRHVHKLPFLDSTIPSTNDDNDHTSSTSKPTSTSAATATNSSGDDQVPISGEEKLNKMISTVYDYYIDSAQSYTENEIFTVHERMFSKKKREKILLAYLEVWEEKKKKKVGEETQMGSMLSKEGSGNIEDEETTTTDKTDKDKDCDSLEKEEGMKRNCVLPKSVSEIPSEDDIQNIDNEILSLQHKLHQLNLKNHEIKTQLKSIHQTKALTDKMEEIMKSTIGESSKDVEDSVSAAMIGKDGLEELCKDAKEIIKKLDDIKSSRNGNDVDKEEEEMKDYSEQVKRAVREAKDAMNRPAKKLTLEEDYEERMKNRIISKSAGLTSNLLKK